MPRFFVFSLLAVVLSTSFANAQTINVGVHYNYKNADLNIGVNDESYPDTFAVASCPELNSPELQDIQRITMELMLICQAVKSSGYGETIKLVPFPNTARGIFFLRSGHIDIMGNTLFREATEKYPDILRSAPVIEEGDFVVGVFTTANRKEILSLTKPQQFKQLVGVSVHSWVGDIKTMQAIEPERLELASKREFLALMIEKKRADFTFSYLAEPVVTRIGGELIRIDGFKASFEGDRAFSISPKQSLLHKAINNYLKTARSSPEGDVIRQAFIHSGFITTDYDDWVDLRLHNSEPR